jgi:hypothetical protein
LQLCLSETVSLFRLLHAPLQGVLSLAHAWTPCHAMPRNVKRTLPRCPTARTTSPRLGTAMERPRQCSSLVCNACMCARQCCVLAPRLLPLGMPGLKERCARQTRMLSEVLRERQESLPAQLPGPPRSSRWVEACLNAGPRAGGDSCRDALSRNIAVETSPAGVLDGLALTCVMLHNKLCTKLWTLCACVRNMPCTRARSPHRHRHVAPPA